jgi:NTP pyrophosphatase (non-canonical NTP hydrolase)
MKPTLEEITEFLVAFRNERDWHQFHNAKDLALALNVEAAELLELYLWKRPEEANVEKVKEELADVLVYALLMAHGYGFDVSEIIMEKMRKNGAKYPVEKAKGSSKKYNEL